MDLSAQRIRDGLTSMIPRLQDIIKTCSTAADFETQCRAFITEMTMLALPEYHLLRKTDPQEEESKDTELTFDKEMRVMAHHFCEVT